jgi:hypothetical protein
MNPALDMTSSDDGADLLPPAGSHLLPPPPVASALPGSGFAAPPSWPTEAVVDQPVDFSVPPAGEEAARPTLGQRLWRRVATRQFLFFSIALHLLFGAAATVYVVQTITVKRKLTFAGTPPSVARSTQALEHRVQMAQKQKSMSAPPIAKRVTTTAVNTKVALPQMPEMPALASTLTPVKMGGMGGVGFGPAASGAPGSSGGGGGGPVPFFGFHNAVGGGSFVGTFYDYKQDRQGHPTRMANFDKPDDSKAEAAANDLEQKEVAKFANGGFTEDSMESYFQGPAPVYSTQIYIPSIPADQGPAAFNVGDKVRPKRWVVIYRASVSAPETGRYRFVGKADDTLIVRFDHRIVLDGCIQLPLGRKPAKTYKMEGIQGPTCEVAGGDLFDVTAGEHHDLEVLIGELPGGVFSVFLQLEKQDVEYAKDANGCPILPLFKLAPSEIASKGDNMPRLAKDTSWSIWKAWKGGSQSIFSH